MVKNLPANAGDIRDVGSIQGSGISPGEGNGNLIQYPCLENPMDRGTWRATVHGVVKELDITERLSNLYKNVSGPKAVDSPYFYHHVRYLLTGTLRLRLFHP